MQDVIVIGGGIAGMAAALQLARARRSVLVIDANMPRNRFAAHAQGFLTQDGVPPDQLAARGKADLMRYPTARWHMGEVVAVSGGKDAFTVTLAAGTVFQARRVILALGVCDLLPDIPGLEERWGGTVAHCPYCHGYEMGGGRIAVIAGGPETLHHLPLFADWGHVTLLTNGMVAVSADQRRTLAAQRIDIESTLIERIEGEADIRLADGRWLRFAGIFVAPRVEPASDLGRTLGLETVTTQMGTQVQTDAMKETSTAGVYACGDVARMPHSLSLAMADGAWAGACVHRSLVFDPVV
ncbi:MAG: NAD(P)/FAD-dependent oxidoreductase [Rhodobacteraceae bacterium]|nr:NAD(P)/FAD-dependent oxidoreductase [Paracoccaceae bacterium]